MISRVSRYPLVGVWGHLPGSSYFRRGAASLMSFISRLLCVCAYRARIDSLQWSPSAWGPAMPGAAFSALDGATLIMTLVIGILV